jgi:dienelactone hydrolase
MKQRPMFAAPMLAPVVLAALAACAMTPTAVPPAAPMTRDVTIAVPGEDRSLPVRVVFPARGRNLPIVLFSHGAYASGDAYDAVLGSWAARGYVVLSPTHRDSTRLGTKRGSPEPRFFAWRLDDLTLLLDNLDAVLRDVPDIAGRYDTQRLAATGHSFGGLVAQTLGGATYFDVSSGQTVSRADRRIRAVLIFSGAGTMAPLLREQDFKSLTAPVLVTVGTQDLAQAPGLTGYEWRRQPFDHPGAPTCSRSTALITISAVWWVGTTSHVPSSARSTSANSMPQAACFWMPG